MTILFWLMLKHFVCDFPLQATPYMYQNKGTYGHAGGISHALVHVVGTLLVMLFMGMPFWSVLLVPLVDGLIHYHIDWAKMNLGKKYNLKPDNSEMFWVLLGLDQWLHFLTYFGIAWYLT